MKIPLLISTLAISSAHAALYIDLTEKAVPTGTGSEVTVTISGSINTDAFSIGTGRASGGIVGNVLQRVSP